MTNTYPELLQEIATLVVLEQHTWQTEDDLQNSIAECLKAAGLDVTREVTLDGGLGRIDLMIDGKGIGIEVKVKGSWQQLTRQVMRYSRAPEIKALLVATTKPAHAMHTPVAANGVPILTVVLGGGLS
ncbi:Cas4 family exonuclease [Arthrobacter phage KBurrousTX]|uniref:Cas4 family exonuclease n=1 Tax=Arthrobacter phage KBurrousTX TaxID=2315608 RepID=A0A386K8E2_9CAUD|nr:Cas4 family exonuclease [Arthrobacter phage KBurrousTX]AYD81581.1 Cas4 family exonuclease [Arthrobacter phage KBurrousTX]